MSGMLGCQNPTGGPRSWVWTCALTPNTGPAGTGCDSTKPHHPPCAGSQHRAQGGTGLSKSKARPRPT